MLLTLDEYHMWVARDADVDRRFLEWVDSHEGVSHTRCTGVRLGEGVAEFELYREDDDGQIYVDRIKHETESYWKRVRSSSPPPAWKPLNDSHVLPSL
jgi:hypothetical protein